MEYCSLQRAAPQPITNAKSRHYSYTEIEWQKTKEMCMSNKTKPRNIKHHFYRCFPFLPLNLNTAVRRSREWPLFASPEHKRHKSCPKFASQQAGWPPPLWQGFREQWFSSKRSQRTTPLALPLAGTQTISHSKSCPKTLPALCFPAEKSLSHLSLPCT